MRRVAVWCRWQSLVQSLPLPGLRCPRLVWHKAVTLGPFGRVCFKSSVICHHGCTTLLDGRPGQVIASWARWRPTTGTRPAGRGPDHVAHRLAGLRGPRAGMAGPGLPERPRRYHGRRHRPLQGHAGTDAHAHALGPRPRPPGSQDPPAAGIAEKSSLNRHPQPDRRTARPAAGPIQ